MRAEGVERGIDWDLEIELNALPFAGRASEFLPSIDQLVLVRTSWMRGVGVAAKTDDRSEVEP